ncbi:MAG TPA: hypothetical protein VHC23_02055, partial [Jatrophihabitans sp.]|nr:hypothetical protein [Jatrophihabitans sp.]
PLQGIVHHSVTARFRAAKATALCGYPAGQVIGQFDRPRTVAELMADLEAELDGAGQELAHRFLGT